MRLIEMLILTFIFSPFNPFSNQLCNRDRHLTFRLFSEHFANFV